LLISSSHLVQGKHCPTQFTLGIVAGSGLGATLLAILGNKPSGNCEPTSTHLLPGSALELSLNTRGICQLSYSEAKAFQLHQHTPNCKNHRHIAKKKAILLIQSDLWYEVDGLSAITEFVSNGYVWKSRLSEGFNVRQMRRLVQG
jgi:hypothetical protein